MALRVDALPLLMMVLSAGASLCYFGAGDWRKAVYWAAASVITASVTF